MVVVVEHHQLAEPQMAGEAGRLRGDALLQVAVRGDHEGAVVDDVVIGPVELVGEATLRDGHAHGVGEALPERPGRGLDPGRRGRAPGGPA
jgi:hypothetical protein